MSDTVYVDLAERERLLALSNQHAKSECAVCGALIDFGWAETVGVCRPCWMLDRGQRRVRTYIDRGSEQLGRPMRRMLVDAHTAEGMEFGVNDEE